jgi:hypothetical protein
VLSEINVILPIFYLFYFVLCYIFIFKIEFLELLKLFNQVKDQTSKSNIRVINENNWLVVNYS